MAGQKQSRPTNMEVIAAGEVDDNVTAAFVAALLQ